MKITEEHLKEWYEFKKLREKMETLWHFEYKYSREVQRGCMSLYSILYSAKEGWISDVELIEVA